MTKRTDVQILSPRRQRAIALALALGLGACSGTAESKPEHADSTGAAAPLRLGPQDVFTAASVTGGSSVTLSGPLHPKEQVTLRAQVSGTVANLRVDRGSAVRRGQVLATIRAAGVQSQAAGARAGVAAAQAGLAVARQRLDAANTLQQAGAMSEIDHRSAQAAYESAQAQVAAARAQAASAGEAAGYMTIVAPINGVVSDRKVQDGESVDPGGELLTVVNSGVLELSGQIAVTDAARVRVGQPVVFSLDAYPNETFRGRVARIDPLADAGTRQVGVYVELANATGRVIGGTYARGSIGMGAGASTKQVVIPATAVHDADAPGASAFVLVVQSGRIAKRLVTLGSRNAATGTIVVLSGLEAGEQVIATSSTELKPGTPVTMASEPAGARPAPMSGATRKE
jgi:membrane fusion protein (multidrug efflux system)